MTICERHGRLRCGECAYVEELKDKIESLQQQVKTLQKEQGWISVKDRLPEKEGRYFVTDSKEVGEGVLLEGKLYACDSAPIFTEDITHWQPLPEPPKEE